jgi:hypothetical protein
MIELKAGATITRLLAIKPGEKVVYYVGDLSHDRVDNENLAEVADVALDMWYEGRACLTQRRIEHMAVGGKPPVFEYTATGCIPPYTKRHNPQEDDRRWRL